MDSDKVLNTDTSRMDFMYRAIAMPRICVAAWLHVPEFIDAINSRLDKKMRISNYDVFLICTEILNSDKFSDKDNSKTQRKEYRYSCLKRGLNHLRRVTESASAPESERTSS